MVLSLVDLSLDAITNGIENGTIRHPHLLPPNLRQRVLDTAIEQDLVDQQNFLEIFTSVEFLNGMTSLTADSCVNDYSVKYLKHLAESMAIELPNGQTVGSAFTKLDLKTNFLFIDYDWSPDPPEAWSDFPQLSDLIALCPNTTSLVLRTNKSGQYQGDWPFDADNTCNGVMENLVKLSLCGWNGILNIERPINFNFKQLTTLELDNCSFQANEWRLILSKIPALEKLHLTDVDFHHSGSLDSILPLPLPQLKWLEITWFPRGRNPGMNRGMMCNKVFVDNLIGCQQLSQLRLMLDEISTDEESLVRLASLDIDLKVKTRFILQGISRDKAENSPIFDSSSRFKIVRIFHEKMESFELRARLAWDEQFSTPLEDVVGVCSNLTKFGIRLPKDFYVGPGRPVIVRPVSEEEMKRINAALAQFFGRSERVLQLKDLCLDGNFNEAVMSAVFENCLNLDRLEISSCSALRDQHLIDWVHYGGENLAHLKINYCRNVTSEGVIPILARSAERLLSIDAYLKRTDGGRDWKTLASNICPNAWFDD